MASFVTALLLAHFKDPDDLDPADAAFAITTGEVVGALRGAVSEEGSVEAARRAIVRSTAQMSTPASQMSTPEFFKHIGIAGGVGGVGNARIAGGAGNASNAGSAGVAEFDYLCALGQALRGLREELADQAVGYVTRDLLPEVPITTITAQVGSWFEERAELPISFAHTCAAADRVVERALPHHKEKLLICLKAIRGEYPGANILIWSLEMGGKLAEVDIALNPVKNYRDLAKGVAGTL